MLQFAETLALVGEERKDTSKTRGRRRGNQSNVTATDAPYLQTPVDDTARQTTCDRRGSRREYQQ